MTGRGLGTCGRGSRRGFGRGFGRGTGRAFGFRRFASVPVQTVPYTKEDEIADLKTEKQLVEREMKAIQERLKELEKE
jgi:hypothetical protein